MGEREPFRRARMGGGGGRLLFRDPSSPYTEFNSGPDDPTA